MSGAGDRPVVWAANAHWFGVRVFSSAGERRTFRGRGARERARKFIEQRVLDSFAAQRVARPAVGAKVTLAQEVPFLALEAGAHPGTVGVVVAHSQLSAGDPGVLVDWGDGLPVRCHLAELTDLADQADATGRVVNGRGGTRMSRRRAQTRCVAYAPAHVMAIGYTP